MTKTTDAHLGANNVVVVLGTGVTAAGISDGTSTPAGSFGVKGAFHGLAVQANSSEELFGLTAGIGGGFVGTAGGIGVNIFTVVVKAFIAGGTTVNQGTSGIIAGASSGQSVVVAATDLLKTLTVAGGVGVGAAGIAGGVDVGVANITVQAYLGVGSDVWANGTVELNALATKRVQTYAVSLGGGVVGVAGSVSVWTVGTAATNTYQSAVSGPGPRRLELRDDLRGRRHRLGLRRQYFAAQPQRRQEPDDATRPSGCRGPGPAASPTRRATSSPPVAAPMPPSGARRRQPGDLEQRLVRSVTQSPTGTSTGQRRLARLRRRWRRQRRLGQRARRRRQRSPRGPAAPITSKASSSASAATTTSPSSTSPPRPSTPESDAASATPRGPQR